MKKQKRNLFDELMQGLDDLAAEREGTMTLREHVVEIPDHDINPFSCRENLTK